MHPAEIFVSYSSRDRALVFPIVEQLKQQGLSVWFDSQRLQGGMKWAQQIVQAIKKCRVFVLMCSEAALHSRAVAQEIQLAWKYSLSYIPVFLHPTKLSEQVEFFLEGVQWIDAHNRELDNWFPELIESLQPLRKCDTKSAQLSDQMTVQASLAQLRGLATFTDRIWPLVVEEIEASPAKRQYLVQDLGPSRETAPTKIRLGSKVFWVIDHDEPAHLLLLDEGPEGQIYCLCPSWFCPSSQIIESGMNLLPPRDANCDPFVLTGVPGREHLLAILSKKPMFKDWLPPTPETPARILSSADIQNLTDQLHSSTPGEWTALATSIEVTV